VKDRNTETALPGKAARAWWIAMPGRRDGFIRWLPGASKLQIKFNEGH
jgi:hypothetical protein